MFRTRQIGQKVGIVSKELSGGRGGASLMPTGMQLSRAFVSNMQLLGYKAFAKRHMLRTQLDGRMFERSNEKAMQDVMYFLLYRYNAKEAKEIFKFVVPVRDISQARQFKEAAFRMLEVIETSGDCFHKGMIRRSSLNSACGERFVTIIWQLSAHLVDSQLIHHATASQRKLTGTGLTSISDPKEIAKGHRCAKLVRAHQLRAIQLHRALEFKRFSQRSREMAAEQKDWVEFAQHLTSEVRAAEADLKRTSASLLQVEDDIRDLDAKHGTMIGSDWMKQIDTVLQAHSAISNMQKDMGPDAVASLELLCAKASDSDGPSVCLDGVRLKSLMQHHYQAMDTKDTKAENASSKPNNHLAHGADVDLVDFVNRWNMFAEEIKSELLDVEGWDMDSKRVGEQEKELQRVVEFREGLEAAVAKAEAEIKRLVKVFEAYPKIKDDERLKTQPDTPFPKSLDSLEKRSVDSVNLLETPARSTVTVPSSLLKSARSAAKRRLEALPGRRIDFAATPSPGPLRTQTRASTAGAISTPNLERFHDISEDQVLVSCESKVPTGNPYRDHKPNVKRVLPMLSEEGGKSSQQGSNPAEVVISKSASSTGAQGPSSTSLFEVLGRSDDPFSL